MATTSHGTTPHLVGLIAERFPIGLPEVFMHCDPQLIRDFYYKWYRPELMAVVVVGDFDQGEQEHVLETIRSTFGCMTNGSIEGAPPPAPLPIVKLPRHPKDLVLVLEDAELTQTSVKILMFIYREKLVVEGLWSRVCDG